MTLRLAGPLLLVGAGKMGGALLTGWLGRGLDASRIVVQDPALSEAMASITSARGIAAGPVHSLAEPPAVIVLAVKPDTATRVLTEIAQSVGPNTVVLSVAAGRTLESLSGPLPDGTAIVRAMPNTPASIGEGITVAVANAQVSLEQREACDALLSAVGDVVWVDDEAMLDAVTAVSGSGPAYVFHLAECLEQAGIDAGLPPALAARLARATVSGAGALLKQSDLEAATLRAHVTSPKGTTAAALDILMGEDGLKELLARAVAAASKRSRDLSS